MTTYLGGQPEPGPERVSGYLHERRYHLRQKLGQGGMGAVYLAEDTRLPGRLIAIKENQNSAAEMQSQFKREAVMLARLRHPNLPQVTDYFIEPDGKQYLVMEYVPGENLAQIMKARQGPLSVAEARSVVEQVMQALAYMHGWRDPETGRTRPIIHRDIKPANIKRTPEGRVVLVDFGIAKVDGATAAATAISARALTPGYAPIEQYHGGTDERSDIYALGATLYALLTGIAPPSATSMVSGAVMLPLHNLARGAPEKFGKVIEKAMQLHARDRYQSVAAMYQALLGRPIGGVVTPGNEKNGERLPQLPNARGHRGLWAAVWAVVLLFVAGAAWYLLVEQPLAMAPIASATVTPPPTASATPVTASIPAKVSLDGATVTATVAATTISTVPVIEPSAVADEEAPTLAPSATAMVRRPSSLSAGAISAIVSNTVLLANAVLATPQPTGLWAIIGSHTASDVSQTWVRSSDSLGNTIQGLWSDGFDVTALDASTSGSWVVVGARDETGRQQHFRSSYEFPTAAIWDEWDAGFAITVLAYGNGVWAYVATESGEAEGVQSLVSTTAFPASQIRQYWRDGYAITALAYGEDGWGLIATREATDQQQVFATSHKFPSQEIEGSWQQGFDITALTYGNGLWAYIGTRHEPSWAQTYQTVVTVDQEHITKLWGDGFEITSIAFGGN